MPTFRAIPLTATPAAVPSMPLQRQVRWVDIADTGSADFSLDAIGDEALVDFATVMIAELEGADEALADLGATALAETDLAALEALADTATDPAVLATSGTEELVVPPGEPGPGPPFGYLYSTPVPFLRPVEDAEDEDIEGLLTALALTVN